MIFLISKLKICLIFWKSPIFKFHHIIYLVSPSKSWGFLKWGLPSKLKAHASMKSTGLGGASTFQRETIRCWAWPSNKTAKITNMGLPKEVMGGTKSVWGNKNHSFGTPKPYDSSWFNRLLPMAHSIKIVEIIWKNKWSIISQYTQ